MKFLVLVCATMLNIFHGTSGGKRTIHVRKKRYLVFPDGSSLAMAFCVGNRSPIPSGMWDEAMLFGVAYDLPNDTAIFDNFQEKKHVVQRRNRRDLYGKMEILLNRFGYDGRSCIFRALCEASRHFSSKSGTIIDEISRIIFNFPQQKLAKSEPEDHRLYHWAYRVGKENSDSDCREMFPECPISLLDMATGYYPDYGAGNGFPIGLSNKAD